MVLVPVASLELTPCPPTDFQLKVKPILLSVAILQGVFAILRVVVGDVWGGLSDAIVAYLGYLAATELVPAYTYFYGMMCGLNCFFDSLGLGMRISRLGSGYFDLDGAVLHNLVSLALLAATLIAALGTVLSYFIWKDIQQHFHGDATPLLHAPPGGFSLPPQPTVYDSAGGGLPAATPLSRPAAFQGQGYKLGAAGFQGAQRPATQ